ncbi:hypothetical protein ABZ754_00480 [Micromonospora purpureochromogenes]|uniref:hypothetical protein n=1 Tax=Micromonospora purpureochromogenes TaxID=47872 RepID=UPI0033FFD614
MSEFQDTGLEAFLDLGFEFVHQPDPVAAGMRPKRRVPLLLLLTAKSRGNRLSWKGVHLLSWAVRSTEHMDLLLTLEAGYDVPDLPIVRIEPAMDRAIDLALGLGFLTALNGRSFQLTPLGVELVREIERSAAFFAEREQLARLRGKLTQIQVERLLEWRAQ